MQEPAGNVIKMSDFKRKETSERRKQILWVGRSRNDLKELSDIVRQNIGYQLYLVQEGQMPTDYKHMGEVGEGVFEIRVHDEHGGNVGRCFYVTKLGDAVAVLHVFVKKTAKTAQNDIRLGQARYKTLLNNLKQKKESN